MLFNLFVEDEEQEQKLRCRSLRKNPIPECDRLGRRLRFKGHQKQWDEILGEVIPVYIAADHMATRMNDLILKNFQSAENTIKMDS